MASHGMLDYAGPQTGRGQRGRGKRWVIGGAIAFVSFGLLVCVLLTNMCGASERANRVKCASNLRQIGQGILLYMNDNKGAYPDRLELLIEHADINAEVMVCPSSNDEKARGETMKEIIADFGRKGHCSYAYVKGLTKEELTGEMVVAYESLSNHEREGMNVLYGDGHVDWVSDSEGTRIIGELKAGFNPPRPK